MIHGDVVDRVLRSKLSAPSVPLSARWLWSVFLVRCDRETGEMLMPTFRLAAEAAIGQQDAEEALSWLLGTAPGADRPRIEPCDGHDGFGPGWRILGWPELRDALERDIVKAKTRQRVGKLRQERKQRKAEHALTPFVPPTVEEVRARLKERGISEEVVDPEAFIAQYASIGWVRGRNRTPVRNWDQCITTWVRDRAQKEREGVLPAAAPLTAPSKDEEFKRTHGGFSPQQWIRMSMEERLAARGGVR